MKRRVEEQKRVGERIAEERKKKRERDQFETEIKREKEEERKEFEGRKDDDLVVNTKQELMMLHRCVIFECLMMIDKIAKMVKMAQFVHASHNSL